MNMNYELLIQNGNKAFQPIVEDGISLSLERKGTPAKLEFTVVKDADIAFREGAAVSFKVDGVNVFYGYVFAKSRDKKQRIKVTCYDQLRYLKNKDTYTYTNKTASELVQMIAYDFNLNVGAITNTGFKIASRVEDNATLFDIIQNALDITFDNTGVMYVLHDDFGALKLSSVDDLMVGVLIDEETAENFEYGSSIDGETYNRIKLVREDDKTKKREVFVVEDAANINNWGVLQYFEKLSDDEENGYAKANSLLKIHNQRTRTLTLQNVLGNTSVRGGSSLMVNLNIGDEVVNGLMMVEKVTHTFKNDLHTMNLSMTGKGFTV